MMIQYLENKLIEDQYLHAQQQMMTPANLGIIKSGKKSDLFRIFDELSIRKFYGLRKRKEFDRWYDQIVNGFHQKVFNIYRDNLVISRDCAYTYSARLLNQYLRLLYCRTWLYNHKGEKYIQLLHPVFSNTFLKVFPGIDIARVNQIKTRKKYYEIIEFYRELIDEDLSDRNNPLLKLKMGEDY